MFKSAGNTLFCTNIPLCRSVKAGPGAIQFTLTSDDRMGVAEHLMY